MNDGDCALVPEWVLLGVSPLALRMYCYLGLHSRGSVGWSVGYKQMVTDLGWSDSTVRRMVKELAQFGAIKMKACEAIDGGPWWNEYVVLTEDPRCTNRGGVTRGQGSVGIPTEGWVAIPTDLPNKEVILDKHSPLPPSGGKKRAECSVCGIIGWVGTDVHRVTLHQPRAGKRTHYVHSACDPNDIVSTGSLRPSFRDHDDADQWKMK